MSAGFVTGAIGQAPRPPRRIAFVLVALGIIAVLIALGIWLSSERADSDRARVMVRRSYEERLAADELLIQLMAVESAQRGYVIVGQQSYLAPYEPAKRRLYRQLTKMEASLRFDGDQTRRMAALRQTVDAKMAEMDAVLADRRGGRGAAAMRRVAGGEGRLLMDRARALVDAVVATEDRALNRAIADADRAMATVRRLIWGAIAAASLVALVLSIVAWRLRQDRYRIAARGHETLIRLKAMFAGTTDAIVILNPSGTIEDVNIAATRLLGFSPAELVRRDVAKLIGFADGSGSFQRRIGIVNGVLTKPIRIDQIAHHRDGHDVPVDIALGLMPLPDGVHVVASLRDISDRRAAERLKEDFISTVSHELRTPLTSVLGSLGLLRGPGFDALPDKARRLIDIADNNARRLIRLVNDILDIDRIGSGQSRLELAALDLRTIAERAQADSRGLALTAAVTIELRMPPDPVSVVGDADRLLQVAGNLLSNAIRFSPQSGTVTIELTSDARRAHLCVEDQGPGVPPEFRARLFERFAQSSAGASIPGGSGLGLTISREIVRAHGGDIWFEESKGGGSRFCLLLDLYRSRAPIAETDRPAVLVCEDDHDMSELLARMIEAEGYQVDRSHSAREAVAMAGERRYAGIVLDLLLPDAGGLGAVRALRAIPETARVPIIVVSATAGKEGEDPAAHALDVVDWIDKPVDPARLLLALDCALRRSTGDRPTLLHVDDDPDLLDVTALKLAEKGRTLPARSLAEARAVLARTTPDIVILDLNLPDGSGLELLPELIAADGSALPTIIYSASELPTDIGAKLDATLVKSRRSLRTLEGKIGEILDRREPREDR